MDFMIPREIQAVTVLSNDSVLQISWHRMLRQLSRLSWSLTLRYIFDMTIAYAICNDMSVGVRPTTRSVQSGSISQESVK